MSTKNLSARFEPEFANKVQGFCESRGYSLKRCMRDALEFYMDREEAIQTLMTRATERYLRGARSLMTHEEFWSNVEDRLRKRERE